jgi:hypothetical protein
MRSKKMPAQSWAWAGRPEVKQAPVSARAYQVWERSNCPGTANKVQDQRNQGHHQQNVNQGAGHVENTITQDPPDKKNHKQDREDTHNFHLTQLWASLARTPHYDEGVSAADVLPRSPQQK